MHWATNQINGKIIWNFICLIAETTNSSFIVAGINDLIWTSESKIFGSLQRYGITGRNNCWEKSRI